MRFALIDLQVPGRKANREHAGEFGAEMGAQGMGGRLIGKLKRRLVDLPISSFGWSTAILREAGHEVIPYQGPTSGEDVILIASSIHLHKEEVAFAIEEKKKHPESRIGFFGPFVRTNPEIFEAASDFLVLGEIESTLYAFLQEECEFSGRLDHGILRDMDRLPTPDWRGYPVHRYRYFPLLDKLPFLTLQASRGCSFDCDFCPYMVSQTKYYRRRSPERVIRDLTLFKQRHGIRSLQFRDIIFTIHRRHTEELCRRLIESKLEIEWGCETRVDCMDSDLADLMHAAGCRGINFGIETGNAHTLESSGKKPPVFEKQEALIRYLHAKGVRVNAFFMLGLVGDTSQTMQQTIDYAKSLNTVGAQFCTMTPFPGTTLYENLKGSLLTNDFSQFNEYQPVVDIKTATPQEVIHFASKAYREYYFRPRWFTSHGLSTATRMLRCFL